MSWAFSAALLIQAPVQPPAATTIPDLGTIRYLDPRRRRELWLGVDARGVYVPASVSPTGSTAWTAASAGAWALALTPWLAVGGRHALAWWNAQGVLGQFHHHEVELSGQPAFRIARERFQDRLAIGVELHALRRTWIDGRWFSLGGARDMVLRLGYGTDHAVRPWLRLGWNAQLRHAWVYVDTQRQIRASFRAAFFPRSNHRLALELVGFFVHRDADQIGRPFDRATVHGQAAGEYTWMARSGVGLYARARVTSGFLSGEAPVYEVREETLRNVYGDVELGVRLVWP